MASEQEDDKLGQQAQPDEQDEQEQQNEQGQQGGDQNDDRSDGHVGGTDDHVEDAAITDEEREAIRAFRREERRARKDRAREREQTYVRQISSLSKQNQDLSLRLALMTQEAVKRVEGALTA